MSIKKIVIGFAATGILLSSAIPAFAAANQHSNCISLDVSNEAPHQGVGSEVQNALEFTRSLGITLGSVVKGEAQSHPFNGDICPEE